MVIEKNLYYNFLRYFQHIFIIILFIIILFVVVVDNYAKGFVFDEQVIEGKIRRPQMVLIQADQRPEFEPIVMKSLGKKLDAREFYYDTEINLVPYNQGFKFNNDKIDYRED